MTVLTKEHALQVATGCRKEVVCRTCPLARLHSSSALQLAVVDQKPDQSLIRNATEWQRLKVAMVSPPDRQSNPRPCAWRLLQV